MIVLEHFSKYTRLPIKINDVADFILERGFVDKIVFHPIEDGDPQDIPGILLRRTVKTPYATKEVADIAYPAKVHPFVQRLICAKELLHLPHDAGQRVRTIEEVSRLLSGIVLPWAAVAELQKMSVELGVDHSGLLWALALLFPRDARDELRPLYQTVFNDEQLSALAEVPAEFIALIMSDRWGGVLDKLCPT